MTEKKASDFCTPSVSESVRLTNENTQYIYSACNRAGLRPSEWNYVKHTMTLRLADGTIKFNPNRGTKFSTYIFKIAYNFARDEVRRQHPELFQDMEYEDWELVADGGHDFDNWLDAHDDKVVVTEALRRLVKEMRDHQKVELLVRYVLNGEKREKLADEYGVENDFVSLVKNRYLPRLQKIVKDVQRQDFAGELVLSDTDISFLKPYMKW